MTTVFASIGGILLAQHYSKKREADDAHRQRKVEIYQKYLNIIGRLMVDKSSGSTITEPSHQEIVDFAVEFKTNLILWGSPKVVNAYLNFLRASTAGHRAVLMSADEMYRAIREDLGLSNRGLNSHQLVRMHLKDPDEKFK